MLSICTGLEIAQVLGSLQVFCSNQHLLESVTAVRQMGWFTVPNDWISAGLSSWTTALAGGLFFTLSIGVGLTVATIAVSALWTTVFKRSRTIGLAGLVIWGLLLATINLNGWVLFATGYVLLIPPAVFWSMTHNYPEMGPSSGRRLIMHTVPFAILVALWTWQADATLFTDIRDRILLTNTFGRWFNEGYYRYTLYAAEVIKPLDRKQLKTADMSGIERPETRNALELTFCRKGYFIAPKRGTSDIIVFNREGDIVFKHKGRTALTVSAATLEPHSANIVSEVEQVSDRYAIFRSLILVGVLVGFPLLLYLTIHALVCLGLSLALPGGRKWYPGLATVCCFIVGLLLLAAFQSGRGHGKANDIAAALASPRWQDRVAGLRIVHTRRLEIGRYPSYRLAVDSPYIAERYWLAKTLALSRQANTYPVILTLLDDPQVNVATMACEALGQRGNEQAVQALLQLIANSHHWYVQWYAYKALRNLGWRPQFCPDAPA